jgi:hypothetical protein
VSSAVLFLAAATCAGCESERPPTSGSAALRAVALLAKEGQLELPAGACKGEVLVLADGPPALPGSDSPAGCNIVIVAKDEIDRRASQASEPVRYVVVEQALGAGAGQWLVDVRTTWAAPHSWTEPRFGGESWLRCMVRSGWFGWSVEVVESVIS